MTGGPNQAPTLTGHVKSLDGLRGLAALAVLIFHFPHFYSLQPVRPLPDERLFNIMLWPIYDYGWMAVDLFFQLSGFVFFWLYADAIAQRKIGFRHFFALRLFRLYPLHLLTLFIVAVEQIAFGRMLGGSFVYAAQDGWHFALNLIMANGLPWAGAESFNGPSWSLSVEMVLYALFFLFVACGGGRFIWTMGMFAAGLLIYKFDAALGRGISGFFLGGAIFLALSHLGWRRFRTLSGALCASSVLAVVMLWFAAYTRSNFAQHHLQFAVQLSLRFLLFPAILTLALTLESRLAGLWRWASKLGNISYSTYLLHIPLQIFMVLASAVFGWGFQWLVRPEGITLYLLLTGIAGVASFHYYETPVRKRLRDAMKKRAARKDLSGVFGATPLSNRQRA